MITTGPKIRITNHVKKDIDLLSKRLSSLYNDKNAINESIIFLEGRLKADKDFLISLGIWKENESEKVQK
jgi:hypothetical protein